MKAASLYCSLLLFLVTLANESCNACPLTFWGSDCTYRCYCHSGKQQCYRSTGVCPYGCNAHYHGRTCSALKPRLTTPPEINQVLCPKVTIYWKPWTDGFYKDVYVYEVVNYQVIMLCGMYSVVRTVSSKVREYSFTALEGVMCTFSINMFFRPSYNSNLHLYGIAGPAATMQPMRCTNVITAKPNAEMKAVNLTWNLPHPKTNSSFVYRLKSVPFLPFPPFTFGNGYVTSLQLRKSYVFSVSKEISKNTWSEWVSSKPVVLLGESERVTRLSIVSLQNPRTPLLTTISWEKPSNPALPSFYQVYATALLKLPSYRSVSDFRRNVSSSTRYTNLKLPWSSWLKLTVSAFYKYDAVFQEGPASKTLIFWTGPGPMIGVLPKPTQATSPGATQLVIEVKPFEYKDGPLQYYLAIDSPSANSTYSQVPNVPRPSDLGLSNAHITHTNLKVSAPYIIDVPMRLTIGDGSVGSRNPPLNPDTIYTIYYVARSYVRQAMASVHVTSVIHLRTAAPPGRLSTGSWAAIIIGICLIVIIFAIITRRCWNVRRARSQSRSRATTNTTSTTTSIATSRRQRTSANPSSPSPNQYHNAAFSPPHAISYPPPSESCRPAPSNPDSDPPPSYNDLFRK